MDDSCAVCAETLEWVAYGACGHREVCSTCIIRLRFICNDRSCCICKSESPNIFVTKALGDYTRIISDFSVLPTNPIEGQVGQYWFHEVCVWKGGSEQKLYNKAQLSQHVKTGDSVIDGSESERGGFTGHPMCEFCKNPFYGDNELYLHMSTEHFTCHICQRQHPGKYEYYNDYDDLETHFRQQHFLCEDEACLAKKFIVFVSESEMKRHVAMEHKGRMSRSKRNSALQIPISFQYQQPSEQDRRGRRHRFGSNSSDFQLSMAIPETSNNNTSRSSVNNPYELLAGIDSEPSSRSLRILGQNSSTTSTVLQESSFPPLPVAPKRGSKTVAGRFNGNTLAARLRNHNTVKVLNSSRPVLESGHLPSSSSASSSVINPGNNNNNGYSLSSRASFSRIQTSTSRVGNFSSALNREDKSISNSGTMKVEDAGSANKVLVEKIRAALNFDDDKFAAFKLLSVEYRRDQIGTGEYLAYVYQFGLEHLVLELAILCPDAQKQRELVEIYNTRNTCNGSSSLRINNGGKLGSKKGKEKYECNHSSEKESLNSKVVNLQLNHRSPVKEAKVSDKGTKGKSKVLVEEEEADLRNGDGAESAKLKNVVPGGGGGNKPRKKVPKFVRNRIGDTSHEESSNGNDEKEKSHWKKDPPPEVVLPVHGVWRNGGGRRLVVLTERDRRK